MTEFVVWVPAASRVQAEVDGMLHEMAAAAGGWWTVLLPDADPQARYAFRLDGGGALADPRSARQPDGPAVLTAPFTPMLFMGEESGPLTPWLYFTDHPDAGLGRAVEATFEHSRLNWADLDQQRHLDMLAWHQRLIGLRRQQPELTHPDLSRVEASSDEAGRWLLVRRGRPGAH
jgi:1,4-alpha-glucan branching enzyme